MNIKLTSAAIIAGMLFATTTLAADYDCDADASHIDHEIGAEKALDAFRVLHGDKADDHHIVEALKKDHPKN